MIAATHMNGVTELAVTDGTIALLNLRRKSAVWSRTSGSVTLPLKVELV